MISNHHFDQRMLMANAGKIYPLINGYDFWLFDWGKLPALYRQPRCWQLQSTGPAVGTLAMKWADLLVVSEPVEFSDDRQEMSWRFYHPSDSNASVLLSQTWEQFQSSEGYPNENFRYVHRIRYYDLPGLLADGILLRSNQPDQWFNTINTTTFKLQGIDWPGLVNPALFSRMGSLSAWASGTWDQQRDLYHPYAYAPS